MNTHSFIPQNSPFKELVHSIWQIDGFTSFHKEYIMPKGIIEIVFNFSDGAPFPAEIGNKKYRLPNCFINGINTSPIALDLPEHQVFFGLCLQPLAVKQILKIPASEFLDIVVDVTLLNNNFHTLWQQLAEQSCFNARIAALFGWLEKKCTEFTPRENLINGFLTANDQHDMSVSQLAVSLCYSSRQLTRKIFEATGMNAEEVLLYKKYLHAAHLVHQTSLPLTEIAYLGRFSDQSHFIRTFKQFTRLTPSEYRRNKSPVRGHIFKDVR